MRAPQSLAGRVAVLVAALALFVGVAAGAVLAPVPRPSRRRSSATSRSCPWPCRARSSLASMETPSR